MESRTIGNPNRTFANDIQLYQLKEKPFLEVVQAFQTRINSWYFDQCEKIKSDGASNFMLTIISCILIDFLSQYIYGTKAAGRKIFVKFIKEYLPSCYTKIQPSLSGGYFDKDVWKDVKISDTATGIYYCFRCGVVHSARIFEYGRINRLDKDKIVTVQDWEFEGKSGREIQLNPVLLIDELEIVFNDYIQRLLQGDSELKKNFIKKIQIEYSIQIKGNSSKII